MLVKKCCNKLKMCHEKGLVKFVTNPLHPDKPMVSWQVYGPFSRHSETRISRQCMFCGKILESKKHKRG